MDLIDIKENYKNFDDYKIQKIATEEVASLRPEVVNILKEEIRKRNLDKNLINSIDSQTKELTESEFKEYCDFLKRHPCPKCKSKTNRLNVTIVGEVVSMLILTNYDKRLKIACSDCLEELIKKANIKSVLLGWWGFPWGPIQTIRSFIFNWEMKKNSRTEKPNAMYTSFIIDNIGVLEASKNDSKKLTELLNKINNSI